MLSIGDNSFDGNEHEKQASLQNKSTERRHNHKISNAAEDSTIGINAFDDYDKETKPLLDEYKVEPSVSVLCTCIPARYTIAIWAFLGFVCLYSMRVNLSVAIVAMVSQSTIENRKFRKISLR
jgi:hypothetical protein